MLSKYIKYLVEYGIKTGLTDECEGIYTTNLLLAEFNEDSYVDEEISGELPPLEDILKNLLDIAVSRNIISDDITSRDLFDTRLMNCLLPRPSEVQRKFFSLYDESPKAATDFYYDFSQNSDYIRRYRVVKDERFKIQSDYGNIDITINLSKPEKDPKAIAAARNAASSDYPKCLLCPENEGYAGRINHPARQNHRIIPLTLNNEKWGFQYSPYVYYNEHCIVFNKEHTPMKINHNTFVKLFDFVKQFPHYFLGSNADLPIVGGSILSHDHFQGGCYTFPMARASIKHHVVIRGYEDIEAGILNWPLSVIRIRHKDSDRLIELADHILENWRSYTDSKANIFAKTDDEPHNTITPIARKCGDIFELDLTLRNNITTNEHPLGLFHPHEKLHHIKKENIGLIEVMGLAVLPARLKKEMSELEKCILDGTDINEIPELKKHNEWVQEFLPSYKNISKDNIHEILQTEIGKVFVKVLEDAGVYKCTKTGEEAFLRFINTL